MHIQTNLNVYNYRHTLRLIQKYASVYIIYREKVQANACVYIICIEICSCLYINVYKGRDLAQVVEHSAVKVWILLHGGSIPHGRSICSLGYFPFQSVVNNWSIKVYGMCCPVYGKVYISLAAYQKEQPMWRQWVSCQEICHNDHMIDVQQPMI